MKKAQLTSLLLSASLLLIITTSTAAVPLVVTISYAQLPLPSQNMTNNNTAITTTTTTANATNLNATATVENATTTANTTATLIITNLTWYTTQQVDHLSAAAIQYQREDPAFAKLAQTTADCLDHYNAIFERIEANPGSGAAYTVEDINRQDLCTDEIRRGINHFCESTDFATFDIAKCEEARKMSETYVQVVETIFG
jgi:hypothetical protein